MNDLPHNGADAATRLRPQARSTVARLNHTPHVVDDALEPDQLRPPRGIFDAQSTLFTRYAARLVFRDKLLGGVPRDPKLIEAWHCGLRATAGSMSTAGSESTD